MAATQRKLVSQLHSQVCCLLDGSANRRMPHFSLHRNYKQQINRNQQHVAANGSKWQWQAIARHHDARFCQTFIPSACVCVLQLLVFNIVFAYRFLQLQIFFYALLSACGRQSVRYMLVDVFSATAKRCILKTH